ncbi:MAG: lamin tail domain-containing protein [Acidobacteria bacterium]|nr:lamin tail domain-containing protein [Acidobacteriota bacterium]
MSVRRRVFRFAPALLLAGLLASAASAQAPTELFFSEYVEGSSLNKAVEIYNGTAATVDLAAGNYSVFFSFNGGTATTTIPLTGTVAAGDVYVLADDGADPAILAAADQVDTTSFFNGDDAVLLLKNGAIIDAIGQEGFDPGSQWGTGDTSTQDNTIRRKPEVCAGDTDASNPFDPTVEWDGFANNTFDGLGSHSVSCGGSVFALLLTEIVVTPTAGEFVEIYNPTAGVLDLSDVYLTDATFAGGGTYYYNLVTGTNAGGGAFADFNARFPAGASIAPGEFQTVAMSGSDGFFATYGIDPTYELFEDGASADGIPDMREALPGSINGQGGLTNGGEVVILYAWDGTSDLVVDLDYAVWGDKDEAVDKTGVALDGPDADTDVTVYLDDTPIADQDVISTAAHANGASYQRVDFAEGTEVQTGGNGSTGADETSENLSVTWRADLAPTPGTDIPPPSGWVINEIHADPSADGDCTGFGLPAGCGDANGDGTVSSTADEFVELVNVSGAAQDISGWTVSDGVGVRHTFPTGTVVPDQCAVVVFGGPSPTGGFGGAVTQIASSGTLGLNNGGDSVVLSDAGANPVTSTGYGSEGGNNQSLTLSPDVTGTSFVLHTTAVAGVLFSPGTQADGTLFAGCTPPPSEVEIYQIQGSGLTSPLLGQTVTTRDNVVTALDTNGFFIQTPVSRTDGDPETSDGVFVFTGSAPLVAVGDSVDVTGEVQEFFDFTELGGSVTVAINPVGYTLPAPVVFDELTPSPNQPQPANELERYEGMLVSFDGLVTGPSDRFGDVRVLADDARVFRTPGILYPGLPGLPVWDGDPQVFDLDPDGLGGPDVPLFAGQAVSATGPLAYAFSDYSLLPTSLTVGPVPPLPRPVRAREAGELTIATQNMLRFFDDQDDPAISEPVLTTQEFDDLLGKFSLYIRTVLGAPDILVTQEVENLNVLERLAARLNADDPSLSYSAYLEEGNDVGGIDVGFLTKNDTIAVDAVTQVGKNVLLSVDGSLLNDRPPLVLDARYVAGGANFPITVIGVHQRSLSGIDDPGSNGLRVKTKRFEQSEFLAGVIQDLQTTDPSIRLVVTGDFNALQFTDGYVDVLGMVTGNPDPAGAELPAPDLVEPDLVNQVLNVPADDRYSFVFDGGAQVLDHSLTSQVLTPLVSGIEYARGNADSPDSLMADSLSPLRVSDHDGLVLYVRADSDLDGVLDGADLCADTAIPESVPERRLLPLHYALIDGDTTFDTEAPGFPGLPVPTYTTDDTAGCSCEQIIDALHLGNGPKKFGCPVGIMALWKLLVSHL